VANSASLIVSHRRSAQADRLVASLVTWWWRTAVKLPGRSMSAAVMERAVGLFRAPKFWNVLHRRIEVGVDGRRAALSGAVQHDPVVGLQRHRTAALIRVRRSVPGRPMAPVVISCRPASNVSRAPR